MYIVVGLGNPGEEYTHTRHNAGRLAAAQVAKSTNTKVKVLVPDTFMNKTGAFVAKMVKSKKAIQQLIVIYDDLDLPFGEMKISFNRGSGGHKGLDSIIRALKTREFIRIRIGISPKKKPSGPAAVEKHILGNFRKPELDALKKVFKRVQASVEMIAEEGLEKAMTEFNQIH